MRLLRYTLALALLAGAAPARAELPTYTVQYGPREQNFAVVHPAAGSAPLLLLHQAGGHTRSTEHIAFAIQREGSFTVLNLEWQEDEDGRSIWEFDVGQIEEAVAYVQIHAAELNVDPSRLVMLGGSRGANLSLLTSLEENAAAPGTVKALVSLSGDADPMKQIERAQRGELSKSIARKLSNVYGCEPVLKNCPTEYIERWSPVVKASASAPAMFLAASEAEKLTASLADEYELAKRLEEFGVPAEVFAPEKGHGFAYWKLARPGAMAFLNAHA